jgi:hypothetical protein
MVVDLGDALANPDGTVSGHRIMVTDLYYALTNDSGCSQGTV